MTQIHAHARVQGEHRGGDHDSCRTRE
jgi:hypothetical protein